MSDEIKGALFLAGLLAGGVVLVAILAIAGVR